MQECVAGSGKSAKILYPDGRSTAGVSTPFEAEKEIKETARLEQMIKLAYDAKQLYQQYEEAVKRLEDLKAEQQKLEEKLPEIKKALKEAEKERNLAEAEKETQQKNYSIIEEKVTRTKAALKEIRKAAQEVEQSKDALQQAEETEKRQKKKHCLRAEYRAVEERSRSLRRN